MTKPTQKRDDLLFGIRIMTCIIIAGAALYLHIDRQNELTRLRLSIPALAKEVKAIQEENNRLKYEIDQFESPIHLMELLRKPEFSHLKYPYVKDVVELPEGHEGADRSLK